jgi:hypothetical protein
MTITYQTDAERAQTEVIRAVRAGRDILAQRVEELEAENARLRADSRLIVNSLVCYAETKICTHEETHRGGAIWEICDWCGSKWADDEGGRPAYARPPVLVYADKFLAALKGTT